MIQPLDLQQLFVTVFSGNMYLFVFVMLILIAGLAARFRMSNLNFGIMIALFGVVMGYWANWLLFIVVVFGGIGIYYALSKFVKQ